MNKKSQKNESPQDQDLWNKVLEVIQFLNDLTGKNFNPESKYVKENLSARLEAGATVEECKQVCVVKSKDPFFIRNPKHLNPQTLFRPQNFERYRNETQQTTFLSENGIKTSQNLESWVHATYKNMENLSDQQENEGFDKLRAFGRIMTLFSEVYEKEVSASYMQLYYRILSPYSAPTIEKAAEHILKDTQRPCRFPRPQEFLKAIELIQPPYPYQQISSRACKVCESREAMIDLETGLCVNCHREIHAPKKIKQLTERIGQWDNEKKPDF